jgi:hypothetical protein
MDTIENWLPFRQPEDIVAEGMWRIATGESCEQDWEKLPSTQKEWWRRCAADAVRRWMTSSQYMTWR